MQVTATEVLDYWVPRVALASHEAAKTAMGKWFGGGETLDREIASRFGATIQAAASGELEHWKASPSGMLAWLIVLDQFTRNAYRGDGKQFAADHLAVRAAAQAVDQGLDQALHPLDRMFVYLPFEHAEDMAHQNRSVALFTALADADPVWTPKMGGFLDYAIKHRVVIEQFGRFPHRNQMLGRVSTPEELAFMAEHGRGF